MAPEADIQSNSLINWVDFLSGSVRPVLRSPENGTIYCGGTKQPQILSHSNPIIENLSYRRHDMIGLLLLLVTAKDGHRNYYLSSGATINCVILNQAASTAEETHHKKAGFPGKEIGDGKRSFMIERHHSSWVGMEQGTSGCHIHSIHHSDSLIKCQNGGLHLALTSLTESIKSHSSSREPPVSI